MKKNHYRTKTKIFVLILSQFRAFLEKETRKVIKTKSQKFTIRQKFLSLFYHWFVPLSFSLNLMFR